MRRELLISALLGVLVCAGNLEAKPLEKNGRTYKFWVEFTDKKGSPYSILRPWDFLSQKAINRRMKAGYSVNIEDIPVVRNYISGVQGTGVVIKLTSRWMNGTLVSTEDSTAAQRIAALPYVSKVGLMGVYNRKRGAAEFDPDIVSHSDIPMAAEDLTRIAIKNKVSEEEYNEGYGLGWKQISMMNGQYLHKAGYKGEGVYVAVLDAGFYRANRLECFDSLFKSGRFLGSIDLVDVGSDVFNDDDHGTQVLSCLASNVNGVMVGTAPNASYLLIRTEDADTETPAEEIQWLCGAEYADSMGVDLISSSLGYTEFDDKSFGHHYNELDGKTTLITRAANMAWERGMVVVNSAGNEGDGSWKYIGAPADAAGVIAVGAVDEYGQRSDFSSFGPTADNRVKPDLTALGQRTTIVNTNGYYIRSNGTSYSAPVLAGAVACLIQANMTKTPEMLRKMLMLSGNRFFSPDSKKGHGLPDFKLALALGKQPGYSAKGTVPFDFWPVNDTVSGGFDLKTMYMPIAGYTYKLLDSKGRTVQSGNLGDRYGMMYGVRIAPETTGKYTLEVKDGSEEWKTEFYLAADNEDE